MKLTQRVPPILLIALPLACSSGGTARFTIAEDNAAMLAIEGVFSDGTTSISLCEDYAAEPDPQTIEYGWCGYAHVVRGHSRGDEHELDTSTGIGCGGCTMEVAAFVKGTYVAGGTERTVRGTVTLASFSGGEEEGYARPYSVQLDCEGEPACSVSASIEADGNLILLASSFAQPPEDGLPLLRVTAATCDEPPPVTR